MTEPTANTKPDEAKILDALRVVVDPEIQMNIIDLGLVYEVLIDEEEHNVEVVMSLTSPGCPFGPEIVRQVQETVAGMEGVTEAEVQIVWDPPWTPDRMSEEARMIFGF